VTETRVVVTAGLIIAAVNAGVALHNAWTGHLLLAVVSAAVCVAVSRVVAAITSRRRPHDGSRQP
jgi:hypothetical protein